MKVRKLLSAMGVFTACALASCTEGETELNNAGTETTPVVSDTNTSNVETTTENNGGSSTTTTEESTGGASTTTTEESKGGSSTTTTTTQQNQNLGTYYANVNTTLKDELFRKNLSQVISVGFVHRTYDEAYKIIAETDEDPNNKNNCICLYTGTSIKKDDHSNQTGFNREHVWAKSHGFPNKGCEPYSDVHHLRVTGMKINSQRGNSDFYEFGSKEAYTVAGKNKYNSDHFEPRDEVKGDVARMMFYMATRYGFDGTYNLTLTEDSTTGQSTGNGRFGNVETLVKWAIEDPVSDAEIYRNNVVYEYQHNRNPYIDHPEYVYLAYAKYAEKFSDVQADEAKAKKVVEIIDALPSNITLDNKAEVEAALNEYNKLNYKEKTLVTNYSKLSQAVNTIKTLENQGQGGQGGQGGNDKPIISDNEKVVDLKKMPKANSFTANLTGDIDGVTVVANVGLADKDGLRLGYNGKNADKAVTIINNESLNVVTLKTQNMFQNCVGIEYTYSRVWDPISYKVYFTADDQKYDLVTEGTIAQSGKDGSEGKISAQLETPATGHFVLVITSGSQACRLTLTKMVIKSNN